MSKNIFSIRDVVDYDKYVDNDYLLTIRIKDNNFIKLHEGLHDWIKIDDWVQEAAREAYCHIVKCPIHPEKGNELEKFSKDTIKYILEKWLEEPRV